MADTRKHFTSQEMKDIKKSGALSFVAAVFGVTEDALVAQHESSRHGIISGPSATVTGKRAAVARLQALSDKEFTSAVEAGYVLTLGQAWGIAVRRVTQLRAKGYTEAPEEVTAPAAKFHSHDGRKSHLATAAHRN